MNKKSLWMLVLLFLSAYLAAACSGGGSEGGSSDGSAASDSGKTTMEKAESSGYPLKITDDVGRKVTLGSKPNRIISFAPSVTETLFAVGAGNRVVGVTTSDDYPPEAKTIEAVGGYNGPNVEKVISLDADLMILSFDSSTKAYADDMQEKTGTKVIVINPKSLEGAISSIGTVADIVGESEKGQVVEERLNSELKQIEDQVAREPKPTVFYEVWGDPLQTAGPGSFIDDAIKAAGGTNIAADTKQAYPQYSKEVLLRKNPDYYMVGVTSGITVEEISGRPGYSSLKAVEDDRVSVVDDNLIVRPGPRIVEGVREIAEEIHPKAFD